VYNFPWANLGVQQIQGPSPGQSANQLVVGTFTTPAAPNSAYVSIADDNPSTGFTFALSTTPCAFPSPRSDTYSSSRTFTGLLPNTQYFINVSTPDAVKVKLTPR
jgi:hypothetical protein